MATISKATDAEIGLPGDEPHEAHQALIDAARRCVEVAAEDRGTVAKLAAMMTEGARVAVTVAFPSGDARITLVRPDGSSDVLAQIRHEVGRVQ